MISFPNAKINLGLNVVEKRPDGYHNIESVFFPVPLTDVLEILPSKSFVLKLYGLDVPGGHENNICIKAYRLLQEIYRIPPVQIILYKRIPAGSGLGGGSSNAAFTLLMLNQMFQLDIPGSKLLELAAELGADCPFFIENRACFVTGKGDVLQTMDVDLKGKFITLIFPGIHNSTQQAYKNIEPEQRMIGIREIVQTYPLDQWKDFLINDFECQLPQNLKTIHKIKNLLYQSGAVYASMTGSGSTVFALSDKSLKLHSSLDHYQSWQSQIT